MINDNIHTLYFFCLDVANVPGPPGPPGPPGIPGLSSSVSDMGFKAPNT